MENVKAELISSLPAAENSVISEPASRLDEKMREEKEFDEVDLVPYLTFFRQLVSDTSPESPRLVVSSGDVKTAAMLSAASDSSDFCGKSTTLQSSTASTASQLRAIDTPLLTAAPAPAKTTATSAKTAVTPAKTAAALPQPGIIASDSFMTAAVEKKVKDVRSEINNILPHGALGLSGSPQSDASVKSKVENLFTQQIRHADQDLSSMLKTEASSRPEHGETKITYTFRRWDASNRHVVEFTVPKDQLTQPLIMTPTTREVRERIDIARDTPGAPVFSLREEGEQHSNRRNVWRFYDEEET